MHTFTLLVIIQNIDIAQSIVCVVSLLDTVNKVVISNKPLIKASIC